MNDWNVGVESAGKKVDARVHVAYATAAVLVLLAIGALAVPSRLAAQSCVGSNVFDGGSWRVDGASDPAQDTSDIEVSTSGTAMGACSELIVAHEVEGLGAPQIFSVKGSGALRPVLLPPADFGATFYMTAYYECDGSGRFRDLAIESLDIHLDPGDPSVLRLEGRATNRESLEADDFAIEVFPPRPGRTRAAVGYTLTATRELCVDPARQANAEGLWIARIASNFVSEQIHDSDSARYIEQGGSPACAVLRNEDGFIFDDPLPLGSRRLSLVHSNRRPKRTPTLFIKFRQPSFEHITPQGSVVLVEGPEAQNQDNVSLWGDWNAAAPGYLEDTPLGHFRYVLGAVRPRRLACE